MWRTSHETSINAPISEVWDILVTPKLWTKVDPKHYRQVDYANDKLEVGAKGKMKTEDSPMNFSFKVAKVDDLTHEVVTQSPIPLGKLTITKKLTQKGDGTVFTETVHADGPLAGLFSKLFFQKQIADTLGDQHSAIKKYLEN